MDWNALFEAFANFIDWIIPIDKQMLLAVNGSSSLFFDSLVKTLTTAATWIPLYVALFYMVLKNNDTVLKVLLIVAAAGLCVLLAGTIDDAIVKPLVARWRPTKDPEIGILVDTVNGYRGGNYGFFSAHASNTFSIAIFFSLLVRSRALTVALVMWSFVNCWTRMYLGVHYPGDIFCGLLWGGIVGTSVWYLLHRIGIRYSLSTKHISTYYTPTGYQMTHIDIVISVLVFTLLYALLRACLSLYTM